jgi:hypothetical protein
LPPDCFRTDRQRSPRLQSRSDTTRSRRSAALSRKWLGYRRPGGAGGRRIEALQALAERLQNLRVRLAYRDMTADDFRRIALSFDGAEEGSHMGAVDFRVGGRIFATLASVKDGFGNLALTPEVQAEFVAEAPDLFVPVFGGWGRMGATHIRLANANKDILTGALHTAWKLRVDKNAAVRSGGRKRRPRR